MEPGIIIGIIIGVIVLIGIIVLWWWISTSNRIKIMLVKIDEADSGIDVALTKRFDLLTKSVATVKGYAKHEADTLKGIVEMRQPAKDAPMKEKSEFASKISQATKALNIVVENYPDLKASSNFLALQSQISEVEEHLQAARRLYNSNVSIYNQFIIVFPSSIVANSLRSVKRDFFEAEEAKRADVNIEF